MMIGSMVSAIWLLIDHIPAGLGTVKEKLGGFPAFFQTGLDLQGRVFARFKGDV
jgi:hypothetical protein